MFQSDDFDDILSDENFSTINEAISCEKTDTSKTNFLEKNSNILVDKLNGRLNQTPRKQQFICSVPNAVNLLNLSKNTPNGNRRKRKFPGPAGLLPDALPEIVTENFGNVIQSSQNYSCSQNQLPSTVFEEGPWLAMKNDLESNIVNSKHLKHYTIAYVKAQALAHQLEGQKVPLLTGVVQSIDRTLQDPLIVLRDKTAEIQCTLHRDAWEHLGGYLVPQYSVMLLRNTTVLTTGTALKKIYLNITNNNILSVYSDEENAYTKIGTNLLRCSDTVWAKMYCMKTLSVGTDKVTILRNSSIKEQTHKSFAGVLPFFYESTDRHNMSDDVLAQTLLEGINTDDLFDDFEF